MPRQHQRPDRDGRREHYDIATFDELIKRLEDYCQEADPPIEEAMETAIEFRRWYAWLIWNLAWKGREHVNSLRELVDIMLELAHRVEAMEQYLERRSRGRWKASDD